MSCLKVDTKDIKKKRIIMLALEGLITMVKDNVPMANTIISYKVQ